ncbi:MAG: type IV pilin N-terminal domain-containing protein [Candidatus Thermoplasmatota archaeon]|nr:type IV pilin N-terminal domain-containing protein [Candidatus Thermoplasmatota archaeon]MBU4144455.1 type IV pilin N-terminal domain-containing protein [Candidatus Thermoplasmatota archaeon]MBU4592313.1 type IV pilin N-terminal domain-containing protein [Candidatus Thermoplasmatota archaeon]
MKRIWKKRDEGVSPVIATILMVAITVVLAAVLYVMVMNLGGIDKIEKPLGLNQQFKTSTTVSLLISSASSGALIDSTAVSITKSGVPTGVDNVTVFTPSGSEMAWYSDGAWTYADGFDTDTAKFNVGATVLITASAISSGDVLTISSGQNYFMPTSLNVN